MLRIIRFVEKVLLLLIGLAFVALALAVLPLFVSSAQRVGDTSEQHPAQRPFKDTAREDGPDAEKTQAGALTLRGGELLCSAQEDLLYLKGAAVAVAADRGGHFTFYGLPDPDTGRPTTDSYDLLRDCSPDLSFANLTSVDVEGSVVPLQGYDTSERTRRDGDSLVTAYHSVGGLRVTQRLSLSTGAGGRKDVLEISYEAHNVSGSDLEFSLSSVLAPPLAGRIPKDHDEQAKREVFGIRDLPGPAGPNVRNEQALSGKGLPPYVLVPRRAAASDSTGRWTPGETGPAPDRMVMAGWLGLSAEPFGYEPRLAYPLPPNAALAVQWRNVKLGAGETVSLSERYAPESRDASTAEPGRKTCTHNR